jgi:hypothetical protein
MRRSAFGFARNVLLSCLSEKQIAYMQEDGDRWLTAYQGDTVRKGLIIKDIFSGKKPG